MREIHDFRFLGKKVHAFLPGVRTEWLDRRGLARKLEVTADQAVFSEIASVQKTLKARGGAGLFTSWQVRRTYTKSELANAQLFQLVTTQMFEPCGEDCGTVYETSFWSSNKSGISESKSRIGPVLQKVNDRYCPSGAVSTVTNE
jgi:hypothetical protein